MFILSYDRKFQFGARKLWPVVNYEAANELTIQPTNYEAASELTIQTRTAKY